MPKSVRQRWLLIGLCLLVLSGLLFSGGLHELVHEHGHGHALADQEACDVCALVCAPAPALELVLEAPHALRLRLERVHARALECEPQADSYPRGPPRI